MHSKSGKQYRLSYGRYEVEIYDRHLHESQNVGGGGLGGKTPYGGRTPGRTPAPGHATPGRMSVRHVGRTPNPYGGASNSMPPPATPYVAGGATPSYAARTPARPASPPRAPPVASWGAAKPW